MFGKLKNKLKSWIGKDKEKEDKTEKVEKAPTKKEKTEKKEEPKITGKQTPEPLEKKIEEIQKETKAEQDIEKESEKRGFFSKIKSKVTSTTLKKEHVDEIFEDLEIILLENNVALEVVDKFREHIHKDLIGTEIKRDTIQKSILDTLKKSISDVLIEPKNIINEIKNSKKPFIVIFFGINGAGKTTSIAKLAHKLKKNNISSVFAAADTFRAASIEQLEIYAKKLNIPIIKQTYGSDPTAVAFDAKKYAEKNKIDCVLIDTAGRMYTKDNLIKQMEKIIRVIKPNLKVFVGESITGNDATEQAKTFNKAVGIDGIILSKADVDEKAGAILSVSYVTKAPILYLGTGQSLDSLKEFKKENVLKNLGLD